MDTIKHYVDAAIDRMTIKIASFLQEVFSLKLQNEGTEERKLLLMNMSKHHFGNVIQKNMFNENLSFELPKMKITEKGKQKSNREKDSRKDMPEDEEIEPSQIIRTKRTHLIANNPHYKTRSSVQKEPTNKEKIRKGQTTEKQWQ